MSDKGQTKNSDLQILTVPTKSRVAVRICTSFTIRGTDNMEVISSQKARIITPLSRNVNAVAVIRVQRRVQTRALSAEKLF